MPEKTKVITKRRKFIGVEIPLIKLKAEIIANSAKEIENRTLKMDLTRQLKGKSLEALFKIKVENNKASAYPIKIKLMPYFIRRMIRKKISYVEDSFEAPGQESMFIVKPFLITRKRVSKAVRKTLRNKSRNWLEDFIKEKKDNELFSEILTNKLQKSLSLMLKKTYPLSLCEIRILEIKRQLLKEEIPKIEKKEIPKEETEKNGKNEIIDQLKEIEQEKIKQAEEEIKKAQEIAEKIEKETETIEKEKAKKQKEEKMEKILDKI